MTYVDEQYNELLKEILFAGYDKDTRSGKVRSIFGSTMRFDLQKGFPILTTKKMFTKGIKEELLWFLRGESNIRSLLEKNVRIWNDDAYRHYKNLIEENNRVVEQCFAEGTFDKCHWMGKFPVLSKEDFLEGVLEGKECVLYYIPQPMVIRGHVIDNSRTYSQRQYRFGDLGPVYGKQWRHFGRSGRDQVKELIEKLKTNPDDRRLLVIAYNPDVLDEVALPPCHVMFQCWTRELTRTERLEWLRNATKGDSDEDYFDTSDEKLDDLNVPKRGLSCMWTQRSVDCCLGLPFNICSYAMLTHIIANCVNMVPLELIGSLGDCHIYHNQFDGAQDQISRKGKDVLPSLKIETKIHDVSDIDGDDIILEGYESDDVIKFPLSVG